MLYKRQKKLLSIIKYGNCNSKTKIFKLAFLTKKAFSYDDSEFYDFVPYHYGAFSFQLQKDLDKLCEMALITKNGNDYAVLDSFEDKEIECFLSKYKNNNATELTYKIYEEYPYYTINSTIHKNTYEIPEINGNVVYTIGYEGMSIDSFINVLIKQDVKMVVDVRANPLSRKYGFSQQQISIALTNMSISYYSAKPLGVPIDIRRRIDDITMEEYLYEYRDSLGSKNEEINELSSVINKHTSALLCFESDPQKCHRSVLVNQLNTERQTIHI